MVSLLKDYKPSDKTNQARTELFDMFETFVVNEPDASLSVPQVFYIDGAYTGGEVQAQDKGLMTVGKMFGFYGMGIFGKFKPQSDADKAAGKPKEPQEPFNSIDTAGLVPPLFKATSDFYAEWFARHPPADGKPKNIMLAYYSHAMGSDHIDSWSQATASDGKSPSIWNSVELPTLKQNPMIQDIYLVDSNVATIWTSATTPALSIVLNEGDLTIPVGSNTLPAQVIAHGGAGGGDTVNPDP